MKRINALTVVALVSILGLAACDSQPATTSVLSTPASVLPTATLFPSATWVPTTEPSPTPTNTSTPTITPQATTTPCPTPTPGGPVGQILFSADEWRSGESYGGSVTPIYLINSDGSGMRQIYEGRGSISDFQLSPDGTKLAFSDSYYVDINEQRYSSGTVYVLDLASGRAWPVAPDGPSQHTWGLRWVSNEMLVYASGAIEPADSSSSIYLTDVQGEWHRQLTSRQVGRTSILDIAVSPDGTQLVFAEFVLDSDVTTMYRISVDGTGLMELITFPSGMRDVSVAWSPTGDWIVVYAVPIPISPVPVYLVEPDGAEMRKITDLPGRPSLLAWTEDRTGLIFYVCSGILGTNEIVEVRGDGSVRLLATGEGRIPACSFGSLSPHRRQFAYSPFPLPGLYVMDVSGGCHYQILSGYGVRSIRWLPENTFLQEHQ